MDRDPVKTVVREARRRRRLGAEALCLFCRLKEMAALVLVRCRLIEADHILGRAHDPNLTVPVCRNCHAIQTARRMDARISMRPPATERASDYEWLKALAVHLHRLAEAFEQRADEKEPGGKR